MSTSAGLRNKIDTEGKLPLIHTLRGVGYKMAVEG